MEIYALHGPSGTGKSTSALLLADSKNIPAIIDDGLLIFNGRRIAGTSAKYEKNYIQAVKRAIFFYNDHKEEVSTVIKEKQIGKILLIGTSINMVNRISSNLELGEIDHYIDVAEIRSSNEIKMAKFIRKTQGKHVIPIPHAEIKHGVFKKLILKGMKLFSNQKFIGETTIVQPNFQAGSIIISEQVIKKIIKTSIQSIPGVSNCISIEIDLTNLPKTEVQIELIYPFKDRLDKIVQNIQQKLYDDFHHHLNIEFSSINIKIAKVMLDTSIQEFQNKEEKTPK